MNKATISQSTFRNLTGSIINFIRSLFEPASAKEFRRLKDFISH
jgi:hypothetical protein